MAGNNQYQRIFENAELIIKHLRGELNHQEQELLNKWLSEDERNVSFLESLREDEALENGSQFFSSLDVNSAWQKVSKQTHQNQDTKFWKKAIKWKQVAILIFFLTAGLLFYAEFNKEKEPAVALKVNRYSKEDVLPGGDKAMLELADGSVVILEQVNNGSLQEQGGTKIVKQDGRLVYNATQGSPSGTISYNKISTPKGGQYHIVLPDGSKVWLNAESTLRFPTMFTGNERQVELTGEAYFEVAKLEVPSSSVKTGKMMPFKVQTNGVNIEVLGTHFNVMAYSNEKSVNTTLLEGSVRVSQLKTNNSQLLKPGQQARVNESIKIVNVDTEEVIAWKNGFFHFNGADIQTVMGQIERWYNVEVDYEGEVTSKHFTGIISREINASKVLDMLELTGGVKFEIKGKRIRVKSR
jgi:ferric-dicitrate binding protein FerR (iron transport regulator)